MYINLRDIGHFVVDVKVNGSVVVYDYQHNMIYCKTSNNQFEAFAHYNAAGNQIHYRNSNGCEIWRNPDGDEITKQKFIKLYGVSYEH